VDGDGASFRGVIVSSEFEGLNRVKRQQASTSASRRAWIRGEIHALSMQHPDAGGMEGAMDKLLIEGGVPLPGEVKSPSPAPRTPPCRCCAPRC
jgi:hypothetical protein